MFVCLLSCVLLVCFVLVCFNLILPSFKDSFQELLAGLVWNVWNWTNFHMHRRSKCNFFDNSVLLTIWVTSFLVIIPRALEQKQWCVVQWTEANGYSSRIVIYHQAGCLLWRDLLRTLIQTKYTETSGFGWPVCQVLSSLWLYSRIVPRWPWSHLVVSKPIYCNHTWASMMTSLIHALER